MDLSEIHQSSVSNTWQVDYITAYLNSKPQATIFIELPDGAKQEGKDGTMDGTNNWWGTLDKEMSELGYYHLKANPLVCSVKFSRSPSDC